MWLFFISRLLIAHYVMIQWTPIIHEICITLKLHFNHSLLLFYNTLYNVLFKLIFYKINYISGRIT